MLALAGFGAWMRSFCVEDMILIWADYSDWYLTSREGSIHWDRISYASGEPMGKPNSLGSYRDKLLKWETKRLPSVESVSSLQFGGIQSQRTGLGFWLVEAHYRDSTGVPCHRFKWVVPYSPFVLLLTLLSAYLILWKPSTKPKEHHHA
jgi:hypothetical protein